MDDDDDDDIIFAEEIDQADLPITSRSTRLETIPEASSS